MKKIISVSRRTDIPAFYGDWFMNRIKDGFVGYANPYGGQKYIISLKQEDVSCFVFWSKNYYPFLNHLKTLSDLSYRFYFNFTITGLPKIFECDLVETSVAIETTKTLSSIFSPKHINWRFDPIILSDITDYNDQLIRFEYLASELSGYVERCYFSFVIRYGKVKRNFEEFAKQNQISISDPDKQTCIALANDFAEIASKYKIQLLTCCGDYLLNDKIAKAHCIDGDLIDELFPQELSKMKKKPTRAQCGCVDSVDIGAYDTCPHGCVYCYANINKKVASKRHIDHDPHSAFLGYSIKEGENSLHEINLKQAESKGSKPNLFSF